jgi:hypothetical protein
MKSPSFANHGTHVPSMHGTLDLQCITTVAIKSGLGIHEARCRRHPSLVPHTVIIPTLSSLDLVLAAANDLIKALQNPSAGSPLAPTTDSQAAALKQLADIFQDCTKHSPCFSNQCRCIHRRSAKCCSHERGAAGPGWRGSEGGPYQRGAAGPGWGVS